MPKDLTWGFFLHMKQAHFAPQLAVVAFGGLFEHEHMGFEAFFVEKRHAVNSLQHRTIAIAAPIGSGNRHQLEPIGRHLTRVLQMWAAAQILPIAVPVHPQRLIAWDRLNQFDLIRFVRLLVMLGCR